MQNTNSDKKNITIPKELKDLELLLQKQKRKEKRNKRSLLY